MRGSQKNKGYVAEWNSEIAYVVGLITTDGNLSIDKRHLNITSNDIQLLNTAKRCLKINNKITPKLSGFTKKKTCNHIQFGNVVLYKWLLGIGLMPNKTKVLGELKVPDRCFFDFLRGHLDGDGCIRKYQDSVYPNSQRLYIRFYSASLKHIKWIQKKIEALIKIKGYIQNGKREFSLTFAKRNSLILLKYIYPEKDIPCLKRKFRIIEEFLNPRPDGEIGKHASFRS